MNSSTIYEDENINPEAEKEKATTIVTNLLVSDFQVVEMDKVPRICLVISIFNQNHHREHEATNRVSY